MLRDLGRGALFFPGVWYDNIEKIRTCETPVWQSEDKMDWNSIADQFEPMTIWAR